MKKVNPESSVVGEAAQHTTPPPEPSDKGQQVPCDTAEAPKPFSAEELRQISAQITEHWFLPVENNRLTLMPVDPWHVHAYWSVSETDIAQARANLSPDEEDAALVLRFTDISPPAAGTPTSFTEHFDIEASSTGHTCYIDLQHDAKRYAAELGLRAADGHFVALTRSNEVETPRSSPSPQRDFRRQKVHAQAPLPAERIASDPEPNDRLLRDLFPKEVGPYQANAETEPQPQSFPERIEANTKRQEPSRGFPETDSSVSRHIALEALLAATPFSATHGESPIEASTHIVIKGRGKPHTLMTLFGERVQVQSDGGFEVRLPLPHGTDLAALLQALRNRHDLGKSD